MKNAKKGIVYLLFAIPVLTQLYPLLWLVLYSLKTNEEILSGKFFALPKVAQWHNYKEAFQAGSYLRYLSNSVFVTVITMVCVILLSSMVAYAISRFRWRYGNIIMIVFMMGMMIPMQATLLPLMIIFKNMHILNTHGSLILPYIAFSTPISVFILSGFMRSIPHEIEESAFVDGASVYRIFSQIILPISVPPVM
ncbi:MAG: carbohydrate ABC transporter permease, partial [Gorillibacterium sp.]|nr:carbohydrate ABC transporter permease [Gorillibacterium sp.]